MAVLSKIKPHSDAVNYFKKLPFCNKLIKKPKVKRLKNIDWLAELPFLWATQCNRCHTRFKQLREKIQEASKSSIKDLLSDLLNEK